MAEKSPLLEQLAANFEPGKLIDYYKSAIPKFRPIQPGKDVSEVLPKDPRFESITQIGEIEYDNANRLGFYICPINKDLTERTSKKIQYDIGKKLLKADYYDAGIFVFYGPNRNFRLSLIAVSYLGPRREFTTFRRYTYFVSPDLTNKTFIKQLSKCKFSNIDDILESFSIDAVNKEFYTAIADKFTELTGGSRKISSKKREETSLFAFPGIQEKLRREFVVRLIGRLVFCWFLKKKHSKDNISLVPEEVLSLKAAKKTDGYYHNILEPLFFEILNKEIKDRHKKYRNNGWDTIPFLNGGLFTPHEDDHYTPDPHLGISPRGDLVVPDYWIQELLEIFERYNFTIDENTPIDIELSVDPEMLGRIFENLLAEIDPDTGETARKASGSYYTPRPIVEYMVDESLKQYLLTKTNLSEDKVSLLLSYSDEDANFTDTQKDSVIDALDSIKIIDPACGSGAFPIGILHKILLILQKVDPQSRKWLQKILARIENVTARKEIENKLKKEDWNYIHKLGIIQNSIYGVDIQPIAVEISKLRCFLSLIVDQNVDDAKPNKGIEPLPNLDFRFVCGNSLIDTIFGLPVQLGILTNRPEVKKLISNIEQNKSVYFSLSTEEDKAELQVKLFRQKLEMAEYFIKSKSDEISHTKAYTEKFYGGDELTKKEAKEKKINEVLRKNLKILRTRVNEVHAFLEKTAIKTYQDIDKIRDTYFSGFFVWRIDFAEVFLECNGFDIVIGNPPYGATLSKEEKKLFKTLFDDVHMRTPDTFNYFISKSVRILNDRGILSFIVSNNLLFQYECLKTRQLLLSKNLLTVLNLGDEIFESSIVPSCVFLVQNHVRNNVNFYFADLRSYESNSKIPKINELLKPFKLEDILDTPGFVFGVNQLAVKLIKKIEASSWKVDDIASDVSYGISTGCDKGLRVHKNLIDEYRLEKELLHKVLIGRELDRYFCKDTNHYIIYTSRQTELDRYPNIKKHLLPFKSELMKRSETKEGILPWFALGRQRKKSLFLGGKIIIRQTADRIIATYDDEDFFVLNSIHVLKLMKDSPVAYKYALALLNSTLSNFIYQQLSQEEGRVFAEVKPKNIRKLYIAQVDKNEQKPFVELADKILALTKSEDYQTNKSKQAEVKKLEDQIDQMVYKLYGLTPEEIKIVEGADQ